MNNKLKILKQQVKANYPQASIKGVNAIAKILEQCCCDFDPCNIAGGAHSSPIELQNVFGVTLGYIHTTSTGN